MVLHVNCTDIMFYREALSSGWRKEYGFLNSLKRCELHEHTLILTAVPVCVSGGWGVSKISHVFIKS